MGIKDVEQINMPIIDYVNGEDSRKTTCTIRLSRPQCELADRDCCANEMRIPQNALGRREEDRPSESMLEGALSSYMTWFNCVSRRRIARLHQPRVKAMDARNVGWEEALSAGNCATLHIRRGDNIDRCNNGEKHFCSMDLTLEDYMYKADGYMFRHGVRKGSPHLVPKFSLT